MADTPDKTADAERLYSLLRGCAEMMPGGDRSLLNNDSYKEFATSSIVAALETHHNIGWLEGHAEGLKSAERSYRTLDSIATVASTE